MHSTHWTWYTSKFNYRIYRRIKAFLSWKVSPNSPRVLTLYIVDCQMCKCSVLIVDCVSSPVASYEAGNMVHIYIYVCMYIYIYIYIYTGLFEMIVGVLTTCHTQCTWDRSICIFLFKRSFCYIPSLYVHPLWFYKHQHDNRVRSKLFVACQRWLSIIVLMFIKSQRVHI